MSTGAHEVRLTADEFQRDTARREAGTVEARAAGLEALARLNEVRAAVDARERERLAEKLGPDHARVADLEARMAAGTAFAAKLITLAEEARTPPPATEPPAATPPVDPQTAAGGGVWTVRGRVTDAKGKPLPEVTVSLYDEDLLFDDRLGQAVTDAEGRYELTYRTGDFRDLIERRPDLYVKLTAKNGSILHVQPAEVRCEASRTEIIDVRVGGEAGRSTKQKPEK
jgi:hypothetical protein